MREAAQEVGRASLEVKREEMENGFTAEGAERPEDGRREGMLIMTDNGNDDSRCGGSGTFTSNALVGDSPQTLAERRSAMRGNDPRTAKDAGEETDPAPNLKPVDRNPLP